MTSQDVASLFLLVHWHQDNCLAAATSHKHPVFPSLAPTSGQRGTLQGWLNSSSRGISLFQKPQAPVENPTPDIYMDNNSLIQSWLLWWKEQFLASLQLWHLQTSHIMNPSARKRSRFKHDTKHSSSIMFSCVNALATYCFWHLFSRVWIAGVDDKWSDHRFFH